MTSARADLEEEILQLSRRIDLMSSAEKKKQGKPDGEVPLVIMVEGYQYRARVTYRM
jgi:hypothetical protein